ncbi:hypothetical protein PR048_018218 [Dryococelus australis]|uniref:Uncharacterized protein n=1 Tax=Dryococelus australis TaxID=614101 RepID=A0ABQ9HBN6_9NEOP|nr:hypothetical protein PR048_018218 [Dryococelus australis]
MLATRPDLCYTVLYFGRFHNCYANDHWLLLKTYTENPVLVFVKSNDVELKVHLYVDSDFASDSKHRKSVSSWVVKLNNIISWFSKKQTVVALSSNVAEYYALSQFMMECFFKSDLLLEVHGAE